MTTTSPMPAVFIGHGSPMNTLEHNRYTQAWSDLGQALPSPKAILAISAHWYINATAVTAMAHPHTIHDFYGFPKELYEFQYPAPGDPALAAEIAEIVQPIWVGQDTDSWGLDHGTWSVLAHMFPRAEIPVIQLSIDASKDPAYHVELGAALAPLRERGVLILGSGNVVHNLRQIQWNQPDTGFDWAVEFDQDARRLMTDEPAEIASLVNHRHYRSAAPTPDHLLPLFYLGGVASAVGVPAEVIVGGCALGSLSMTSYIVGGTD